MRCEKAIEDGRWIQMEGGNVLCDKCWKNMYLPKVRLLFLIVSTCDRPMPHSEILICFGCFTVPAL